MEVHYLHTSPESELPEQTFQSPFAAVVILGETISAEWWDALSRWLVRSGCLFMMSWGVECKEFHDSVDWANIQEFDPEEIPDDKLVLTTWHDDEPLEEVFWFAQHSAHHDAIDRQRIIILDMSKAPREADILRQLARSFDLYLQEGP